MNFRVRQATKNRIRIISPIGSHIENNRCWFRNQSRKNFTQEKGLTTYLFILVVKNPDSLICFEENHVPCLVVSTFNKIEPFKDRPCETPRASWKYGFDVL